MTRKEITTKDDLLKVIEILEKNIEVNYIILSDILIGEELLINLIRKINEINKNIGGIYVDATLYPDAIE